MSLTFEFVCKVVALTVLMQLSVIAASSLDGPGASIPPCCSSLGTTRVSIQVPDEIFGIESVVIRDIRHTFSADLYIQLEDPSGALYRLRDQMCGGEDLLGWTWTIVEDGGNDFECPLSSGTFNQMTELDYVSDSSQSTPLSQISGPAGTWTLVIYDRYGGDIGSFSGWTLNYNPDFGCTENDRASAGCSENARCSTETGSPVCTCRSGFTGDGVTCDDIDECSDETLVLNECDHMAYCENSPGTWACVCPAGFIGDGSVCHNDAFSIRVVAHIPGVDAYTASQLEALKAGFAGIVTGQEAKLNDTIVETMPVFSGAFVYGTPLLGVTSSEAAEDVVTLFALFETEADADAALAAMSAPDWSLIGADEISQGPNIYRWRGGSTSDALDIPPTGLSVDQVFFEPSCLDNGCWKVNVTYTKGSDDFNVFFIPKAEASDALSYDPDYTALDSSWGISQADTFLPSNHPCTSMDYDPSAGSLPAAVTSCCIPEFLSMYRPVSSFSSAVAATGIDLSMCGTGDRSRAIDRTSVPWFVKYGDTPSGLSYSPPQSSSVVDNVFVDGTFEGLVSNIYHTEIVDSYIGIYKATLELDEVEVRTLAGQLKGTVGVEHTVDTFVGIVNFSPTGSKVLDTGAVQTNIHLEKTSFFTVSTHGTNDYTFLEYVNMRLVAIYNEDSDFSGDSESGARTVRTDSNDAAHYVQVTFTLGSQYEVNTNSGLIPLDSVRAGKGTFFSDAGLDHKCLEWTEDGDYSFARQSDFESTLGQTCAPAATMCSSPATIPDSFIAFNIPLGVDFYDPASVTLDNNVFVDMVISAIDTTASGNPNSGDDPKQMKTTLTASIPVVAGGVNIFCDGYTAKTDLKDVANVDIVVGSADTGDELTRLRIKKDIASTQLAPDAITQIDSDSIEAGLMTLVIKGNASYFGEGNPGRSDVSMELEDVITIHIMEADGTGADTDVSSSVMSLITDVPDDNTGVDGLDTDGYNLNGAFYFTIDRSAQRAHLEPSSALLSICPFNPPRPSPGNAPLETCVTRRDVRYRDYPWRTGAQSTAMEICAGDGTCPARDSMDSTESSFFVTIFGDNDYAKTLAANYATVIDDEYDLNGRYRRAYWINPGYEWTPTQTGGTSIFSVSQKLYLFALVTLDEGIAGDIGQVGPGGPNVRRRALLQSVDDGLKDGQANFGGEAVEFQTSPSTLMAKAFDVPADRVATFAVQLSITEAEACMSPAELQDALRGTLADYLSTAASAHKTVQVTKLAVDKGSVQCRRRSVRSLLTTYSDATADVTMLVVFETGTESVMSIEKLQSMPGIQTVAPVSVSAKVSTTAPVDWSPAPAAKDESSSSNNGAIIGGAVGGAVGVLVIGVAVFFFMRKRTETAPPTAVQALNVADLKTQLADDV